MRASLLPRGAKLVGAIRGHGDLTIAGEVEGPIELDGQLTIEREAIVRGDVRVRSVVVRGELVGAVHAETSIRLEAGARVIGDARAERVSAAEGALLRGRIRMSGGDRMRRTAGGTITAPFTSSGNVASPSPTLAGGFRVAIEEPNRDVDFERRTLAGWPAKSEAVRTDRDAELSRSAGVPVLASEPKPGPAPDSVPPTEPSTDHAIDLRATASRVAVPRPAPAKPKPPPPFVPALGRVKSKGRDQGAEPSRGGRA